MYTTALNPNPEEYKRVVLDNPKFLNMTHGFYQDPKNSDALIAPPRLVDESIRSGTELRSSSKILRIEDPDPEDYEEHIAMRIRGEVPLGAKYADKLTLFDPRFHRSANNLLLSPTHMTDSMLEENLREEDNPIIFGDLAGLDIVREMGETELFDKDYEGDDRFIGFSRLIELGIQLEEEFDNVEAKYGGNFFLPSKGYPHGTFEITSIYAWMDDKYDEYVYEWMEDKLVEIPDKKRSPDEFDEITENDEENPDEFSYVRAWWD